MAFAKAITSNDIIAGLATVLNGNKAQNYDNPDRDLHWASGDSLLLLTNIDRRYKLHGGAGGSGNWEH